MPAIKTGKKTQKYSTECKVKALDIHPFMLSRWCEEYREGTFAMMKRFDSSGNTNGNAG